MKKMLLLMSIALAALCWGYWSHMNEWRDAEKSRQEELWHTTYYDNGKPRVSQANHPALVTAAQ